MSKKDFRYEEVIQLLLNLQDEDTTKRRQANSDLVKLGIEAKTVLTKALKDKKEKIRTNAALALGILIENTVRAYNNLLENKGEGGSQELAWKLDEIQQEVLPELINALKDKEVDVRREAAHAIAEMEERAKQAVPTLGEILKDKDQYVRGEAAQALCLVGEHAISALPAIIEALKDEFWEVRSSAVFTLGEFGEKSSQAIPDIIELMKNEKDDLRWEAADALCKIGKPAVSALVNLLQEEGEDIGAHWAAAETLVKIGDQVIYAVPTLVKALKIKDNNTDWQSQELLDKIGEQGIPTLIELLNDEDEEIRKNSARILGRLGNKAESILPIMERQLIKEKDEHMKFSIAIAILEIEGKKGLGTEMINDLESKGILNAEEQKEYNLICKKLSIEK